MQENAEAVVAPRRRRRVVLVGILVTAGAVGLSGMWLAGQPQLTPAPSRSAEAPRKAPEAAPPAPVLSVAESDALLRAHLAGASSEPEWAVWLAESGLVRRWVGVVMMVGEGESPRTLLGALAPSGRFEVRQRKKVTVIDPRSYARYDAVGRVAGSLDAQVLAATYRAVRPVVEAAWRETAPQGRPFDEALRRAFAHLLAVPVVEGDVQVLSKGALYTYADERLEALTPAQKHLLRMGPRSVRAVQDKVRQLSDALGQTQAEL